MSDNNTDDGIDLDEIIDSVDDARKPIPEEAAKIDQAVARAEAVNASEATKQTLKVAAVIPLHLATGKVSRSRVAPPPGRDRGRCSPSS